MNADRLRRAHELFEELIDASPEAQAQALSRLTTEDEALAAMLRQLLSLDQDVGSSFDTLAGLSTRGLIDEAMGQLPEQIAGMKVLGELGRGGMGVVYEAQQLTPSRRVALKTLAPLRDSPELQARLRAEVEALARVEHPGVPAVYQVLEHEGLPVLAMELVRGQTIGARVRGCGLAERLSLLQGVTEAIAAAHAQGLVHRDIKPANVMVNEDDQVKVLDFGIAALEGETPVLAGTPAYSAPEQLSGLPATPATDVYGLGALGWFLFTGHPPSGQASAERRRPAGLSRPLHAVLSRALDPSPLARYPNAAALLDDLNACAEHRVVSPLLGQPGAHVEAFTGRHPLALRLLAILVVFAVGAQLAVSAKERDAVAARERNAHEELEAIRGLSQHLGAEHPVVTRAFDAFTSAPVHVETLALHEAWRWSYTETRSLAAAGMAWVTAPDEAERTRSLEQLAERLAEAERWGALGAVLEQLPSAALREERLALALHRWDGAEATPLADPELRPVLNLLREATPAEAGLQNVMLRGGRRAWTSLGQPLRVLSPNEASPLRIPTEGGVALSLSEGPDGALWFLVPSATDTAVWVLEADSQAPRQVERLPQRCGHMVFADVDGDGTIERYVVGANAEGAMVADPAEGSSRPLAGLNFEALRAGATGFASHGGVAWLPLVGWGASGVYRIEGLPARAEVTGRLRMAPKDVVVARGPDGPRVYVSGRHAGALPAGASERPDPFRLVRLGLGSSLEPVEVAQIPGRSQQLMIADLDGDGVDELLLSDGSQLMVRRLLPEGESPWLRLPGLEPLAAGQADDDPADELLVRLPDGSTWMLGVAGTAPLPARSTPPRDAPARPPADIAAPLQRTWARLEELVAFGLTQEAAQLFEHLGARADATGTRALLRALALYTAAEDRQRVARALPGRPLQEGERAEARRALIIAHDLEGLAHLDGAPAPRTVVLDAETGLGPPWRFPAPEGARPAGARGVVELLMHSARSPGALLPLDWDGGPLSLILDVDVLELDWATRLVVELVVGEHAAGFMLGRGGASEWGLSDESVSCIWDGDGPKVKQGAFALGPRTISLSWHPEAGTARCGVDEESWAQAPSTPPPPGPLWLRLRAESKVGGAARVLVRSVSIIGARPAEGAAVDLGLMMALGDPQAIRALSAAEDPTAALAARRLLGLPAGTQLRDGERDALRALLRTQPAAWIQTAAALLGDALLPTLLEAWDGPIQGRDPWAQELLRSGALPPSDARSELGRRLNKHRAEALIAAGRIGEAEQLLATLRALDEAEAWRLTAQLRDLQGDREGAIEALLRWQALSPTPEQVLERALRSPELAPLLRANLPTPPQVD